MSIPGICWHFQRHTAFRPHCQLTGQNRRALSSIVCHVRLWPDDPATLKQENKVLNQTTCTVTDGQDEFRNQSCGNGKRFGHFNYVTFTKKEREREKRIHNTWHQNLSKLDDSLQNFQMEKIKMNWNCFQFYKTYYFRMENIKFNLTLFNWKESCQKRLKS